MGIVRKIGIGIACTLLVVSYVLFLQVMIWPAFAALFVACGFGIIFGEKQ